MPTQISIVLFGRELESLYTELEKRGYGNVLWFGSKAKPITEFGKVEFTPNTFFVFYIPNAEDFSKYTKEIIEITKRRAENCKVMLCGPFANEYSWRALVDSNADFVCIGDDDETTVLELVEKLGEEDLYQQILGLGFKQKMFIPVAGKVFDGIFLGNKRKPKSLNS